jgi:Pyruvate/2-oxoacid:ferredoxin oxidoreductase gamma subunit
MQRIRFQGRGGQGMKTASHIVGSASSWGDRYAQDSLSMAPSGGGRRW